MVLEELQASSLHKNRVEFHYNLNGHGFTYATSKLVKSGMVIREARNTSPNLLLGAQNSKVLPSLFELDKISLDHTEASNLYSIYKIKLSNSTKVQSTIEMYN